MSSLLLIRLALTVAILVGLWMQYPRFVRRIEEIAQGEVNKARTPSAREQARAEMHRKVRGAKALLVAGYLLLVMMAWLAPLPVS